MDNAPHFDGPDYIPELDHDRLTGQIKRVKDLMLDGQWRTLAEIESHTGDPPASISAQLRHLRKERFGVWTVEKRRRGDPSDGLFEYRVLPPEEEVPSPRPRKYPKPTLDELQEAYAWLEHAVRQYQAQGSIPDSLKKTMKWLKGQQDG